MTESLELERPGAPTGLADPHSGTSSDGPGGSAERDGSRVADDRRGWPWRLRFGRSDARRSATETGPAIAPHRRPVRRLAPRDARWFAGAAVVAASVLLLGFVAQVALFSGLEHQRALLIDYDLLRTSLAKGEAPVGPLDPDGRLLEPGTPVALLQIPRLGLTEVVSEGTSAAVLRSGAGHRRDTVMPGQVGTSILMGRQLGYGGPFGALSRLSPGDELTLTTGQGPQRFRVFALRRAGDPLPQPIVAGQSRLELVTADGPMLFPSGVLHVDAMLVGPAQAASAPVINYAALPDGERAMGSDLAAWPLALAVTIALLLALVGIGWLWRGWGWRLAWLVGVPLLLALGVACADLIVDALPNLL